MILSMLIPVASLIVTVVLQFSLAFRRPQVGIVKTLAAGFLAGMAVFVCFEVIICLRVDFEVGDFASLAFVNFVTYFTLFFCYFNFVHIVDSSVRIRILREVFIAENGLSRADILADYNAALILETRLKRLTDSGQVSERSGRFFNSKPKMLYIALFFRAMKVIVLGHVQPVLPGDILGKDSKHQGALS